MSRTPYLPCGPAASPVDRNGIARRVAAWWWKLRGTASSRRARRVVLMVGMLWLTSMCDLLFTLWAREIGGFHEVNPIAKPLIGNTAGLVIFKVSLLVLASSILIAFRRRLLTELACWLTVTVYTGLSFIWCAYYSFDLVACH